MTRRSAWVVATFLCLVSVVAPAFAVITALIPLSALLQEPKFIVAATVEALDAEKLTAVLTVEQHLKGKLPFTRLPVNLNGTAKKDIPDLTKRLAPKLPVVLF